MNLAGFSQWLRFRFEHGQTPSEPSVDQTEHDEELEAQELLQQLRKAMPTIERGKVWLEQATSSLDPGESFISCHRDCLLALAPDLSRGATNAWLDYLDYAGGDDERERFFEDVPRLMLLLSAFVCWQIAAAARALHRQKCEVEDLDVHLWPSVEEETRRYLQEQDARHEVLDELHQQAQSASMLFALALRNPEPSETPDPNAELIVATWRLISPVKDERMLAALAQTWKIMDVATIGMLYRSFGEHLHDQSV
jgi:hypothetical protein